MTSIYLAIIAAMVTENGCYDKIKNGHMGPNLRLLTELLTLKHKNAKKKLTADQYYHDT